MFVLKESEEFDWPVDVKVPVGGGKVKTQRFTARFRPVPSARQDEINDLPITRQNVAQGRECLVGWGDDIQGEDGEPLEFSEEARDSLLDIVYVAAAVARAYWDAMSGKAARKN